MGTKGGRNWYQLIPYDVLSCQKVSFTLPQETLSERSINVFRGFSTLTPWVSNISQRPNIFLLQSRLALKNHNTLVDAEIFF
jgi:hypothetical protein